MAKQEDKVRVQISYSPDKERVGKIEEVDRSEGAALVAEGRARYVDSSGKPVKADHRGIPVSAPRPEGEQPDHGEQPAGPSGVPVLTTPPAGAGAPAPAGDATADAGAVKRPQTQPR